MCSVSSRVAQADFVRTQLDEAQVLLSKHKWAEAAIVLRSAIRREPRSASANADLAKALLYLGRREEALSVLGEAIEQNKGRSRDWLIEQNRVIAKIFVTNATFQSYQDGVDLLSVGKFRPARENSNKSCSESLTTLRFSPGSDKPICSTETTTAPLNASRPREDWIPMIPRFSSG